MLYLNGDPVPVTIFPDKTSQVWKIPEKQIHPHHNHVEWMFESEAEFMHLAQLRALLEPGLVELYLPYLPYGRQDKEPKNDRTFALYPFLVLLDFLDFDKIVVFDPHNPEIVKEVLTNVEFPDVTPYIKLAKDSVRADAVCFPDAGASRRYGKLWGNTCYAEKTRDQFTGEITNSKLTGYQAQEKVLIIDDICDGGATFVRLAKNLYAAGAKEVHLYVSHGLFTKGTQVLRDAGIKRIFTKYGEMQ